MRPHREPDAPTVPEVIRRRFARDAEERLRRERQPAVLGSESPRVFPGSAGNERFRGFGKPVAVEARPPARTAPPAKAEPAPRREPERPREGRAAERHEREKRERRESPREK